MRYFFAVWYAWPSKWTPLAVVMSTNLPGCSLAARCAMTLPDAPFCALAAQQPSRIAVKPNALNREKIRFLIRTCLFYLRRPAPAVARQLSGNLYQCIQIPRQLAWKP